MGWTFFHKPAGVPVAEVLAKEFSGEQGKVVASSAKLNAVYMAYKTRAGHTIALVCAIRYAPKDPQGYNFGYKDMEESMGPYYYDCPAKILNMLSPVDIAYAGSPQSAQSAARWRQACWDRLGHKAPKMAIGRMVRFANPIRFTTGETFTEMRVSSTRPLRFTPLDRAYGTYKITQRLLQGATVVS